MLEIARKRQFAIFHVFWDYFFPEQARGLSPPHPTTEGVEIEVYTSLVVARFGEQSWV